MYLSGRTKLQCTSEQQDLERERGLWHITAFFEVDAAIWWRWHCNKMDKGREPKLANSGELQQLLIKQFQIFNHYIDVRDCYTSMRQIGSVNNYINRFRSVVVELPHESNEDQVYQFLKGLNSEIQASMRTHKPCTLKAAMDIADEADRAKMQAYRGSACHTMDWNHPRVHEEVISHDTPAPDQPVVYDLPGPTPMDVGAVQR